jgi:hypothetical protein
MPSVRGLQPGGQEVAMWIPFLLAGLAFAAPVAPPHGPSTGFVPLGAAPLPGGAGAISVNAGALVAPVDFGFGLTGATTVASYGFTDGLAVAAWGGTGGADPDRGYAAGGLGRLLLVHAPGARIGIVGGAHYLEVRDQPLFPWVLGVTAELGAGPLRADLAVGAPWVLDAGLSALTADGRHQLRFGLSVLLPTLGYRYVGDTFFVGFDVASILAINAAWLRVGVRFGD